MPGRITLRRTLAVTIGSLAACLLLIASIGVSSAGASSVVSSSGQISSCYVKKGKAKGTLRVVPAGRHCRRGEKRLSWNAQGQSGGQGSTGSTGQSGQADSSAITQLQTQVATLEGQVAQLQGLLSGLTNSDLLGAVNSVPAVTALCGQAGTAVTQLNGLGTTLTGLSLTGVIPLGLLLNVPSIPSALPAFTCP